MRDTGKMHRVLASVLPRHELELVFAHIISMFNKVFPALFAPVQVKYLVVCLLALYLRGLAIIMMNFFYSLCHIC